MQFYYLITDPFSQKFKTAVRNYFFPEEIVLTTESIQNLFGFHILLTLQQSSENFPLEIKFIKFQFLILVTKHICETEEIHILHILHTYSDC